MGLTPAKGERDKDELNKIVGYLQKMDMFKDEKTASIYKIAGALQIEVFEQGALILEEGAVASCLFIIADGVVGFEATDPVKKTKKALASLGRGQTFGEFGLVYDVGRTAAAKAESLSVVVLRLDREVYETVKTSRHMKKINARVQHVCNVLMKQGLKQIPFLENFDDSILNPICALFKFIVANPGERLAMDKLYLVLHGELVMTKTDENEFPYEIARFTSGHRFGEMGLIDADIGETDVNSTYITAMVKSELFYLEKQDFEDFASRLPKEVLNNLAKGRYAHILKQKADVFKYMKDKSLNILGTVSELEKLKSGTLILEQGKSGNEFLYVIWKGTAQIVKDGKVIRILEAGYFGEISLFTKNPNSSSVRAQTDLVCLKVPLNTFKRVLEREGPIYSEIAIKVLGKEVSLDIFLKHPLAQKSFFDHCFKESADENLKFYDDVTKLHEIKKLRVDPRVLEALGWNINEFKLKKSSLMKSKCRHIFDNYIFPGSPDEVNLSSRTRTQITEKIDGKELDYDIFDIAKSEVLYLIEQDNFSRYKESEGFKKLLGDLRAYQDDVK